MKILLNIKNWLRKKALSFVLNKDERLLLLEDISVAANTKNLYASHYCGYDRYENIREELEVMNKFAALLKTTLDEDDFYDLVPIDVKGLYNYSVSKTYPL